MKIHHFRTLVDYDGPQVFEARDEIGGQYIAVLGPPGRVLYLIAGVAPSLLRQFCDGKMDLLDLLMGSYPDARFTTTTAPFATGTELETEPFREALEGSDFLPAPGFVLAALPSTDLTHAADASGIRLEASLSDQPGRIGTGAYRDLIHRIQVLARSVLVAVEAGKETWRWNEVLDVVGSPTPGSFRVLFETSARKESTFSARMSEALRQVDILFQHSNDPARTLEVAAASGADVAMAYRKLLELLAKHGTGLRYTWMGLEGQGVRRGEVSKEEAIRLIAQKGPSVRQQCSHEGKLYRYNSGTGFWGLMTGEGRVLGRVAPGGPDLGGLAVGGWYRFLCEEEYDVATWKAQILLVGIEEPELPGQREEQLRFP